MRRPLDVIAAFCLAGGAAGTALAAWREATVAEPPTYAAVAGPAPSAWGQGPSASMDAVGAPTLLPQRAAPAVLTPTLLPRGDVAVIPAAAPVAAPDETLFTATYYDFPAEVGGVADTPIYTNRCELISVVPASFHDRLCVQGSGRLVSGETVSFAGRDCSCAAVCPRTGQRICYDVLDADRFPCGRGATGRPITPLRTVAVDPAVIPMGELLFIPELAGLPQTDGSRHDGCFVAEDKGIKVKGRRIDVFTGDESTRRRWEASFPSHAGVHVYSGATRCRRDPKLPLRGCDARRR